MGIVLELHCIISILGALGITDIGDDIISTVAGVDMLQQVLCNKC